MTNESKQTESAEEIVDEEYLPPAIESVMTPEDLTREVQYAGVSDGITGIR